MDDATGESSVGDTASVRDIVEVVTGAVVVAVDEVADLGGSAFGVYTKWTVCVS